MRTGLVALALTAAAAVLFHGLDIALGTRLFFTHDLSRSDIWHLHYPLKHFYAAGLSEGRLPLWCPHVGTGLPLHAEGQVGALYPLNLLLFGLLPLPLAFNWGILLHGLLAGAFAAMFARQVGASRGGSLVAALVFAFSGFLITHLKHINMTAAAAWLPLLLLLLERYAAHGRRRILAAVGLVTGVMFLAGHPQIAYYNLLAAAAYSLFLFLGAWHRGPARALRFAAGAGAAVALGILTASAQILPTLDLAQQGPRKGGLTYEEATEWDYVPAYLLTFLLPKHFGDPGMLEPVPHPDAGSKQTPQRLQGFKPAEGTRNFFWEISGYVGILPLCLALAALFLGYRNPRTWLLAGGTAMALILVLGKHGGLVNVLYAALPGFDMFRFHDRFLLHVDLFLAVLAGLGLTCGLRRLGEKGRTWIPAAFTAGILALCTLDLHFAFGDHNPTVEAERWTRTPGTVERIRREEADRGEPFRIACFDRQHFVFLNAYHRARGWKGDLSPYDIARDMVYPDLNLLHGLDSLNFYHPLHPDEALQVLEAFHAPDLQRGIPPCMAAASLYNVRYILTPFGALEHHPGLERVAVFPGDPDVYLGTGQAMDLHLFRNTRALPRAFLVPEAVQVRAPDGIAARRAVAARLARPGFDPRRQVLLPCGLDDPPAHRGTPGAAPAGTVRFLDAPPDAVRLEVTAPRDCWLFLGDTYDPGWSASVDGREAEIHPANLGGRAVRIPKDTREVHFTYAPRSFRMGTALSILGLLCLAALAFFRRSAPAV